MPRTVRALKLVASSIAVIAAGVILASLTVFHTFPLAWLEARLNEALRARAGLGFSSGSLERSFPFVLAARDIELTRRHDNLTVMRLDELRAAFKPLSVFTGALRADLTGGSDGGALTGEIALGPGGVNVSMTGSGLGLQVVPYLADAGISGPFDLESSIALGNGCPSGRIMVESAGLKASGLRLMGLALPIDGITAAGAEVLIRDCVASIERAWLDGGAFSARLGGTIAVKGPLGKSHLDLTLEVVPKGDIAGDQTIFRVLDAYRRSANYYSIPIRGTLERPSLGG
jgi:type II secretion system protein N